MKVYCAFFRKKQSTCGLIMNAVACLILTWLVFELCYDYISDSIKQIFHWCLFKKMFSVKCLFPMLNILVYEAKRSSNAIFFHSAFFVMEKWEEDKNAHSCLCGTTFYCLTLSSHHAPPPISAARCSHIQCSYLFPYPFSETSFGLLLP